LGHGFEYAVDTLERDERYAQEFIDDFPARARAGWYRAVVLKWFLNAVLIGGPFTLYCLIALGWNLYANIAMNRWWAEGNVFLMANTIYLAYQIAAAIPMVFEIQSIIKEFKGLRLLNLLSAAAYNLFFFVTCADLLFGLYYEDKGDFGEEGGPVYVFIYMVIAYNIIFHAGIVPVNGLIMYKELQLVI